jgi:hypothetical protein
MQRQYVFYTYIAACAECCIEVDGTNTWPHSYLTAGSVWSTQIDLTVHILAADTECNYSHSYSVI